VALYDPIDRAGLLRELIRPDGVWTDLQVVDETGSTNADLVTRARSGAPSGSVLIANYQSAGRGRQGRVWTAPRGTGVAVSVLLHPVDMASARWGWLPLLAGLGVSEGLRCYPGVPAVLKWPNDVLIGDGKVAGILVERVDTRRGPAVVVGFGINVHLGVNQLPVPSATSLALHAAESRDGGALNRTIVIGRCLETLGELYLRWATGGAEDDLAASYRDRCTTIGRQVRVELAGGRSIEGTATSVDSAGRLVVRTAAGLEVVGAGDVIHLRGV
jgi:BirA family transcriptional regulator, biotin operon repressor / biotin---[acetyl-CoA-carboxylase] ligase